jgi:hypothetical protein
MTSTNPVASKRIASIHNAHVFLPYFGSTMTNKLYVLILDVRLQYYNINYSLIEYFITENEILQMCQNNYIFVSKSDTHTIRESPCIIRYLSKLAGKRCILCTSSSDAPHSRHNRGGDILNKIRTYFIRYICLRMLFSTVRK